MPTRPRGWRFTSLSFTIATLCLGSFAAVPGPTASAATTLTVTTPIDANHGACTVSLCSLRDAVIAANATTGAQIVVPAGTYNLTLAGANEDDAATGDLDVNSPMTIQGAGQAQTVIDGQGSDRGFQIRNPNALGTEAVAISGLTVQHGAASSPDEGGGILIDYDLGIDLTLTNVTLDSNSANDMGGGLKTGGGTTTLTDVNVTNNTASAQFGEGGGIEAQPNISGDPQQLLITRGTISGNATGTDGAGGGISTHGTATITGTTISGNTVSAGGTHAGVGGGIVAHYGGVLNITNSTVANNSVDGAGGGLWMDGAGNSLTNVTFTGNTAPATGNGGGLYNVDGTVVSKNVLMANNSGGNCQPAGSLETNAASTHNASSDASCGLNKTGDVNNDTGLNQLGSLADNGGTNQTVALHSGNPAIDAGDNASCPATDQRDATRITSTDPTCDIGAYEFHSGRVYSWSFDGSSANNPSHSEGYVAVDQQGDVYAVAAGTVEKFDASGIFLQQFGTLGTGDGQLAHPCGIAVDLSEDVYVDDCNLNRIVEFQADGTFVRTWGWGVSDGSAQFEVCNDSCRAGLSGSGPGQFGLSLDIAVGASGTLYVTDFGHVGGSPGDARIEMFDPSGAYLGQFGQVGDGSGDLANPLSIATDASGNVYVADQVNNRVEEYTAAGTFVQAWGKGVNDGAGPADICTTACTSASAGGFGPSEFGYVPEGIGVNAAGHVFVGDCCTNNRLEEFDQTLANFHMSGWGVHDGQAQSEVCTSSCQGGIGGYGVGQISRASDVAVDNSGTGDVYLMNDRDRIQVFDQDSGAFIREWRPRPALEFDGPRGLALDSSGNVFVADTKDNWIRELGPTGGPSPVPFGSNGIAGALGAEAGGLDAPSAIARNAAGGLFVADPNNHRVDEFTSGGAFQRAWGWGVSDGQTRFEKCTTSCRAGISGGGAGQIGAPVGIAAGPSGTVYVTDQLENRVDEYTWGGAFLRAWGWGVSDGKVRLEACTTSCRAGISGGGAGQLAGPDGIAVEPTGSVYVADQLNNRVEEYTSNGSFLRAWGWGASDGQARLETCTTSCRAGASGGGIGQLQSPSGLALDSQGNVFVADTGNDRVEEYRVTGTFVSQWGSLGTGNGQFKNPAGVAAGPQGRVDVLDTGNNRVQLFEETSTTGPNTKIMRGPTGSVTSTTAVFVFSSPDHQATFECRLDGADWQNCASPRRYVRLTLGNHELMVRAVDTSGNADLTPATRSWKVVRQG